MSLIRVMLVDDSTIVRGLMQRALRSDPEIEVEATAVNGQMALDLLKRTAVDVIILDIEMPVMDGLTALPQLLEISKHTRVIMASTLTLRNAEISMQAMELGASDYLAKPSTEKGEVDGFYEQLITKVKTLGRTSGVPTAPVPILQKEERMLAKAKLAAVPSAMPAPLVLPNIVVKQSTQPAQANALAIASSTGGPAALLSLFQQFKGKQLRTPIFLTQHMPPNFTTILADHISKAMGGDCHEARDGEEVKPGVVYMAPGDFHMTAVREAEKIILKLDQNPPENFCRPAADPMFRSLAKIYGKNLLCVVLTGIGMDGTRGAAEAVSAGATVIAQDEETSVVYGMPKSVAEAKLTTAVLPLPHIGPYLLRAVTS